MPTSTFFRLPEEKRIRLVEAGWTELTQARFAEISINRIIAAAHIPRGSFYQYFLDKEDMIRYLLEDMREYFIRLLQDVLKEAGGDLFAIPLGAFDRFVRRRGATDPVLNRFIQALRLNQGLDIRAFMAGQPGLLPDLLWEQVDPSSLREQDRLYADHVFYLLCAVLAYAVAETLRDPTGWERQRKILQERLEMLRYGCAAPRAAEQGGTI